jgi:hypothetical protein
MAAFNSRITGVEADGSMLVAKGEKERRPSSTDARAKELARGALGSGGAGIRRRLLNEEDNEEGFSDLCLWP